jgi:hypothetical protein
LPLHAKRQPETNQLPPLNHNFSPASFAGVADYSASTFSPPNPVVSATLSTKINYLQFYSP